MKCECCKKEGQSNIDIHNFVVSFRSWQAYNTCSVNCAKEKFRQEEGKEPTILSIEN